MRHWLSEQRGIVELVLVGLLAFLFWVLATGRTIVVQ